MSTIRCHCGAVNQSHYKKCLGCGSIIDGPDLVGPQKLVVSAIAQGRTCTVLTYRDGRSPIQANLLFHDPEDAAECARILSEARKPMKLKEVPIYTCSGCGYEWHGEQQSPDMRCPNCNIILIRKEGK